MNTELAAIFSAYDIDAFAPIPISKCRVRRCDLIDRAGLPHEDARTAIMFLIPYYTGNEAGNVSLYARGRDYHLFCAGLFPRLCGRLAEKYGGRFVGFADKSPIEETDAASRAGLGRIGDSYVIINEKYGSFVFIGEILTDIAPEAFGCDPDGVYEPSYCDHCMACRRACPMLRENAECLSAVTQKKGALSEAEEAYIKKYGSAWGCDICQTACPLVKRAIDAGARTPIRFFYEDRICDASTELIDSMDDEEFASRAFSWRGRETLLRNLKILGK